MDLVRGIFISWQAGGLAGESAQWWYSTSLWKCHVWILISLIVIIVSRQWRWWVSLLFSPSSPSLHSFSSCYRLQGDRDAPELAHFLGGLQLPGQLLHEPSQQVLGLVSDARADGALSDWLPAPQGTSRLAGFWSLTCGSFHATSESHRQRWDSVL